MHTAAMTKNDNCVGQKESYVLHGSCQENVF